MRIFSFILPSRVSGLLFSEFLLTFGSYLLACFIFVQGSALAYLNGENGWLRLALVSFSVLIGIFVNNLYARARVDSRVALVLRLCNVFGIALVFQGLSAYLLAGLSLPRLVMVGGSALAFVTLTAWRIFYSAVILRMVGTQNILFIGNDSVLEEIASRVREHPELGFGIAGYIATSAEEPESHGRSGALGQLLGTIDDLESVALRVKAQRVIVGMLQRGLELPVPVLLAMARRGVAIEEESVAYESLCGRVCSRELRPSQIIFHNELAARPGSVALQSIYTNLLALAAIIVTSPVLILCALAVKLTSKGPLLQPQLRVGLHGIPFSLHRFRIHSAGSANPAGESLDGRLTTVGRWLHKLHLVHLPCLFNLLRGEITLVGPRPERPEFADELSRYFAYYQQRHSIKPGMTGWSQINTSSPDGEVDSLRQLEYDLYYTKHISLALDAYILLHGLRAALPFARH
ncbi:MAG: sugar transferase [Bryobacterales bacterium]|nr:sugar transferase [Bryobacterales bacterium]